ncbi:MULTISPECIES: hypothetical protein [unclassified Meridianimarinicoccus]|uniref:hypothetical protein n=1 Tax=unclassified Meridianimarinicoccus TaxID=2923344 RepID=UPI00186745B2|nr:hypothetical protein [Fluviibacterium sp. MJW13]
MADSDRTGRPHSGPAPGPSSRRTGATAIIAIGAGTALVWAALYLLVLPRAGDGLLGTVLGLVLPLVLICLATALARALHQARAELEVLKAQQTAPQVRPEKTPPPRTSDPVPLSVSAMPLSDPQPALPMDPVPAQPLALTDLIRALHFPETQDDAEGFRSLARALKDPQSRQVVQAAQDMLTLLSQDGIYVDDIDGALPDAATWQAFAEGARHDVAIGLALFQDTPEAEKCRRQLHTNTVYRDTVHHFLRRFDHLITSRLPDLDEPAITALTATRSARAFLLLGAAADMFGPR